MLLNKAQLKLIIHHYLNENNSKKEFENYIYYNEDGPEIGGMESYVTEALIVVIDDLIKDGEVGEDIYDLLNDIFKGDPEEINLDDETISELLDFQKKLFARAKHFTTQYKEGPGGTSAYKSLGLNVNPDDLDMEEDYIPFEKAPKIYFKILDKKLKSVVEAQEAARKKKEKQAAEKANLKRIKNFKPQASRCKNYVGKNFNSIADNEKESFITCHLYDGNMDFEPYLWDELKDKKLSEKLTSEMREWLINDYAKKNKIPEQHKHKIKFGDYIYPEDL